LRYLLKEVLNTKCFIEWKESLSSDFPQSSALSLPRGLVGVKLSKAEIEARPPPLEKLWRDKPERPFSTAACYGRWKDGLVRCSSPKRRRVRNHHL
jgi:hypothetical protein